jgi:ComEC/Rec2-related protein
VCGILLQALAGISLVYYIPFLMAALVASVRQWRFLFVAVISLSAVNVQLRQPLAIEYGLQDLTFSGIVVGETHYPDYSRLSLRIDRILLGHDTLGCSYHAEYYAFEDDILLGRRVAVKGRVMPSRYGHRPSLLTGKIIDSVASDHVLGVVFRPLKTRIDDLIKRSFKDDHYMIASGLILGGSSRLVKELRDAFSRAGILHILAVSGLHVGFVAMLLGFLLYFIPLDHRFKFAIVIAGLFLYAGITGFRPSVCRATLMAFLFGLAHVLQRNVDHMHVLNLTALAFLIAEPLLIFDISAQLSFAAVYGILYLYPKLDACIIKRVRVKFLRFFLAPMAVSFSAQLFVAPLLIFYFRRLPTYSVFTNLLIVPLAALIIVLLFIYFASASVWFSLAAVVSWVAGILISLLITVSKFFAALPLSSLILVTSPLLVFPLYLLAYRRMRKWVAWGLVVLIAAFSVARSVDCLAVCMAAKSIMITVPSGEKMLISTQTGSSLNRFLEKENVDKLDYLVASEMSIDVRKKYMELPDRMHFKRIVLDLMEIDIARDVTIRYRDVEISWEFDAMQKIHEAQKVKYLLTNGRKTLVVQGPFHASILEQMILDTSLALARLRLSF